MPLGFIRVGDPFKYNDNIYMRLGHQSHTCVHGDNCITFNVVNLATTELKYIPIDAIVGELEYSFTYNEVKNEQ